MIPSTVFSKKLSELLDIDYKEASQLRKNIDNNGYLMFNLKPFLFYCLKNNIKKKKQVIDICHEFQVHVKDISMVKIMFKDKIFSKLKPLCKYAALSFKKLKSQVDKLPMKLFGHTRKFIYSKMRFIINNQHYAVEAEDLVNELVAKGIYNVLATYPKIESLKHAENIAKRAIQNNGVNMIYFYTCAQRGVVRRSEDGETFYSNIIPLTTKTEEVIDTIACPSVANTLDCSISTESWIVTNQVINSFIKKKRRIVSCLMGIRDEKFSTWLIENTEKKHRLYNDDLFDDLMLKSNIYRYFKYLAEFSGYSVKEIIEIGKQAASMLKV